MWEKIGTMFERTSMPTFQKYHIGTDDYDMCYTNLVYVDS